MQFEGDKFEANQNFFFFHVTQNYLVELFVSWYHEG